MIEVNPRIRVSLRVLEPSPWHYCGITIYERVLGLRYNEFPYTTTKFLDTRCPTIQLNSDTVDLEIS